MDFGGGGAMVVLFCKKVTVILANIPIFIREMNELVMAIPKQNLSQVVKPFELCMLSKLFHKVSLIDIKTNRYFWSRSYGK